MFSEVITQIENRLLSACLEETDVKFPEVGYSACFREQTDVEFSEVITQKSATLLALGNRQVSRPQRCKNRAALPGWCDRCTISHPG